MEQIDQGVLLLFNGHHIPWLDSAMMAITGRWTWVPFYALLVALLFWRCGWRKALLYLVCIAMTIALADQICAHLIRPMVERLRPCSPLNPLSASVQLVNGYAPGSYSFPSCHGANTFALATFMSLCVRRRAFTAFMFLWAALVSCSRLYLGVHYPSDILAGAAIGALIALGVYHVSQLFVKKI